MAALPASQPPGQSRYRRLADGTYLDTKTGQKFPGDMPPPALNKSPDGISGALAKIGAALNSQVQNSATHAPDIAGALSNAGTDLTANAGPNNAAQAGVPMDAPPVPSIGMGDPSKIAPAIKNLMGPSTGSYNPQGGNILSFGSRSPQPGAADIMNREGGHALPVPAPALAMKQFGPSPAPPTNYGNMYPSGQDVIDAALPPKPLAAQADTSSPLAGALPSGMPRGGATPGAQEAALMQGAAQPAPVIGDPNAGGFNDIVSQAAAGKKLGKGLSSAFSGALPDNPVMTPGSVDASGHQFGKDDAPPPAAGAFGAGDASPDLLKGKDLMAGLPAMAGPLTTKEQPGFLSRLYNGAFGDPDPTVAGGGGQLTDEDKRGMLEAGLATMAAAGRPGATVGGALGEGGLYALQSGDVRKDRADTRQDKKNAAESELYRFLYGEKATDKRHDADVAERTADRTARTDQYSHENYLKASEIAAKAAENGDRAAHEKAMEALGRQRNGIAASQVDLDQKKYGDESINRATDNYTNAFRTNLTIGKTTNPLTGILENDGSGQKPLTADESRWQAAQAAPNAPAAKQDALNQISAIQARAQSDIKAGKPAKDVNALAAQAIASIQKKFFPDVK